MSDTDRTLRFDERSDATAILRPSIAGEAVDVTAGTWQFVIKPRGGDGLDDDSGAVLTVTTTATEAGSVLTVLDESGVNVWQLDIAADDMPDPGRYTHVLWRTAPRRTAFAPSLLVVADV